MGVAGNGKLRLILGNIGRVTMAEVRHSAFLFSLSLSLLSAPLSALIPLSPVSPTLPPPPTHPPPPPVPHLGSSGSPAAGWQKPGNGFSPGVVGLMENGIFWGGFCVVDFGRMDFLLNVLPPQGGEVLYVRIRGKSCSC